MIDCRMPPETLSVLAGKIKDVGPVITGQLSELLAMKETDDFYQGFIVGMWTVLNTVTSPGVPVDAGLDTAAKLMVILAHKIKERS